MCFWYLKLPFQGMFVSFEKFFFWGPKKLISGQDEMKIKQTRCVYFRLQKNSFANPHSEDIENPKNQKTDSPYFYCRDQAKAFFWVKIGRWKLSWSGKFWRSRTYNFYCYTCTYVALINVLYENNIKISRL
jgi:hypothetical protein